MIYRNVISQILVLFCVYGGRLYALDLLKNQVDRELSRMIKSPQKHFCDLSVWTAFFSILKERYPHEFVKYKGALHLDNIKNRVLNLATKKLGQDNSLDETHAILDFHYFFNGKLTQEIKKPEHPLYAYVFFRAQQEIFPEQKYAPFDFENIFKSRTPLERAYYLTHIILYDSHFFRDGLNAADYAKTIDELDQLIPYFIDVKNADILSEIYLCLNFLGAKFTDNYQMLKDSLRRERFVFAPDKTHLKVVLLLAKIELEYDTESK